MTSGEQTVVEIEDQVDSFLEIEDEYLSSPGEREKIDVSESGPVVEATVKQGDVIDVEELPTHLLERISNRMMYRDTTQFVESYELDTGEFDENYPANILVPPFSESEQAQIESGNAESVLDVRTGKVLKLSVELPSEQIVDAYYWLGEDIQASLDKFVDEMVGSGGELVEVTESQIDVMCVEEVCVVASKRNVANFGCSDDLLQKGLDSGYVWKSSDEQYIKSEYNGLGYVELGYLIGLALMIPVLILEYSGLVNRGAITKFWFLGWVLSVFVLYIIRRFNTLVSTLAK